MAGGIGEAGRGRHDAGQVRQSRREQDQGKPREGDRDTGMGLYEAYINHGQEVFIHDILPAVEEVIHRFDMAYMLCACVMSNFDKVYILQPFP